MALKTQIYDEQLNEIAERLSQLRERQKRIEALRKNEMRKEHSKTASQITDAIEKIIGRELTPADAKKVQQYLEDQERRGKYFSRFMNEMDKKDDI